jgi:hypothetical protein
MRKALIVVVVGAVALVVAGVALSSHLPGGATGGGVDPVVVAMADANLCEGGQKLEDPADGPFPFMFGAFLGSITIDVYNTPSGPQFDFWTDHPSHVVTDMYVKGGPTANLYDFGVGVTSDTGLHSPINDNNDKYYGLSHICVFSIKKG